ncbi:succinylglutamate desuccinylase/aspartoacylase family protein [Microvirga sp. VF16]|uniref:succinylglutamate desuccinylase/aspartoacylase family protein n=1 Tax=Microvirga sp. VF16 TaxID=2807101 RepID=UPI00193E1B0E|nr:succinylglutamate desuccinylase/aspartoacylase family protein [Microvirga sp. VF16]QRM32367.1 succinylglutamate desuccinylase/aspartoacylase family protein [Microvirga sp. VF16]
MALNATFDLNIDLDQDGRFDGYLHVKTATERSPFGWSMIPVTSVRNGAGPCAIIMGGCHGDEYEGQLVSRSLLADIRPEDVTGQLIILPAANAPAVQAGTRFSPVDGSNLNGVFPGRVDGTPTERIACFIETVLLPRASVMVDIHSGGKPVDYVPSTMISGVLDGERKRELVELVKSFGLPVAFFVDKADYSPSSVLGACDRAGVFNISVEVGGGGSVSWPALDMVRNALLRLLNHLGIIQQQSHQQPQQVCFLRRLPVSATVCSPATGLFEPRVELGSYVEANQLAGFVHSIEMPWSKPIPVNFKDAGFVLCRRFPVETRAGDGLFKLAVPAEL